MTIVTGLLCFALGIIVDQAAQYFTRKADYERAFHVERERAERAEGELAQLHQEIEQKKMRPRTHS